jgi:hypothetical protein
MVVGAFREEAVHLMVDRKQIVRKTGDQVRITFRGLPQWPTFSIREALPP